MIDPDDIEQVRTALRQILAWVDQGKRPTHGDLTAVDWYTLALLPCPDVEEMAGGPLAELSRLTTPRPLSELTAADGEVLLWLLGSDGEVHCRGLARFDSAVVASRASEVYRWSPLPKVRKPDGAR